MTEVQRSQKLPPSRPGPEGGKRDRNRQRKTRELLEAAQELFLESGVEGATVGQIAKRAGQAKGSFYRYFDSKEHLVRTLLEPVRSAIEEGFTSCSEALRALPPGQGKLSELERSQLFLAYTGLGLGLAALVEEYPSVARLYLQESRGTPREARAPFCELSEWIAQAAIQLTELAQAHRLLREIPPAISALAVIGAAERLLHEHLAGRLAEGVDAVEILTRLVLEGLTPE